jgi:hypothetical protein
MSKGSKRRPEDKQKIDNNWDRIFNKENKNARNRRRSKKT